MDESVQIRITLNLLSFNKLLLQKEQLEQKHLHLLQVGESDHVVEEPGDVEPVAGGGEREDR